MFLDLLIRDTRLFMAVEGARMLASTEQSARDLASRNPRVAEILHEQGITISLARTLPKKEVGCSSHSNVAVPTSNGGIHGPGHRTV